MKKILLLLTIISVSFTSCKEEKTKTEVKKETKTEVKTTPKKNIDVITWKAYKITGDTHSGTINVKSSNFKFNDDSLIEGIVIFDMNTIKNSDIKDADYNAKLVKHLKNADFFNVVKHPTSKFEFSNVDRDKEGKLEIKGNLTINGITKEIKFPATIQDNILTSSVIKVDRTDFGVKYKSSKFFENLKDRAINDEFDVAFKLKLKK